MSVIAFLQKMLDAGLPLDMAMKAAAAHEEATAKKDTSAERQRRYRARKASSVTQHNVTDATVTDSDAVTKKVFPTPLSKPSEPKGSSEKLPARVRAARRCPENWEPRPEDRAVGEAEGFSPGEIERQLAKFRDHTFGTARSDWSATFRNWLRNSNDKPRKAHERPANPTDARFLAKQQNLADAFAGAEIASRLRAQR